MISYNIYLNSIEKQSLRKYYWKLLCSLFLFPLYLVYPSLPVTSRHLLLDAICISENKDNPYFIHSEEVVLLDESQKRTVNQLKARSLSCLNSYPGWVHCFIMVFFFSCHHLVPIFSLLHINTLNSET